LETLLTIAFRITNEASMDPFTDNIADNERGSEIVMECLRTLMTEEGGGAKALMPDGDFSAEIMIIGEKPLPGDANIGTLLAGSIEMKASDCECCHNLQKCASANFLIKCEKDFDPFITNWNNPSLFPDTAGDIISDMAILGAGGIPANFRFVRKSWFELFRKMRTEVSPRRMAYVTTLVKRLGDAGNAENDLAWLKLERELCSKASLVICLGGAVFNVIAGDAASYESVIGKVTDLPFWGKTLAFPSLEELMEDRKRNSAIAASLLDKALGGGTEDIE